MATEILRPNAAGDETNIPTLSGAATHWEAVAEAVADDSTTYVATGSSTTTFDSYNVDDTALTTETVDSLDAFFRIRGPAAGAGTDDDYTLGVRLSATDTMSAEAQLTDSYADYTNTGVARPGGGSWAVADLDDVQLRVGIQEDGGGQVRATQGYITVNYTAGAATIKSPLIGGRLVNNSMLVGGRLIQ